jgi:uncharacterized protein YbjT (DUF2867 family)
MFVIAGASGKTGKVVAETLLSQGKQVRVVVRDAAKAAAFEARGAQVALASLDDTRALVRALEEASGFYTPLPEDFSAADFHGHRRRMADAMGAALREARVPHVVFLSAAAAMLAEGNGPAKDLHYAEQVLRASAQKVTFVRAAYFQENVLGSVAPAKHEGVYPNFFPSADFAFPTVATRDIGRFAARLLVEPPPKTEVIDLVGPAYSARDMAQKLGHALGKTLRVVDVPPAGHVHAFTSAGFPRPVAEAVAEMLACFASGRVKPQGDRTELASTTLDEVLRDTLGG